MCCRFLRHGSQRDLKPGRRKCFRELVDDFQWPRLTKNAYCFGIYLGISSQLGCVETYCFLMFYVPIGKSTFRLFWISWGIWDLFFFLMALWSKEMWPYAEAVFEWGDWIFATEIEGCHGMSWLWRQVSSGVQSQHDQQIFGGFGGFPWIFPCLNPWIPWWIHRSSLAWPFWASSPQQKMWPALQCFDMRYRRLNTHCIVHWLPIM